MISKIEDAKPVWQDSSTVNPTLKPSLKDGITYMFIVNVASVLDNDANGQEVWCILNNVEIGSNGSYHDLTSNFIGLCKNGDAIKIGSYKNGGNFAKFTTRVIYIPL